VSTVEIENVSAIRHAVFDMPKGEGGVMILMGESGAGKTTAIRCLAGLLGNKDELAYLSPSDGAERGSIQGLGRSVTIGAKNTSKGAAEVPVLDKRIDIGVLVDPGVDSIPARTKARVKSLVSIGGVKVTPMELLGEKNKHLAEYIDMDEAADCDDPVAMANILKRALEAEARAVESESDRKAGAATARRTEAGDIDELESTDDYETIVKKHREATLAVSKAAELNAARESAIEANARIEQRLKELKGTAEMPDMVALSKSLVEATHTVETLEQRLAAAKQRQREAKADLERGKMFTDQIASLEGSMAKIDDTTIDMESLQEAEAAASRLLENAMTVERRRAALEESKRLQNESAQLVERSLEFRSAAALVVENVSKALPEGPIKMGDDGLLVVQHKKRGKSVPMDQLSTGELWRVVLPYAIKAVGKGGIIPVSQESWQALGDDLKREIDEICRDNQVWLVSAQVGSGSLRVERFDAESLV
jgi:energy-coupling factor transporter ATP-binding protein EcfA2